MADRPHQPFEYDPDPGMFPAWLQEFRLFFVVQFVSYAFITWNFRAIAQAQYVHVLFSDLVIAALNFKLIKKIAEAHSNVALAGYTIGGAAGSLASVWVTKQVLGQ